MLPEIRFNVVKDATATLTGTVSDSETPVQDAIVTVSGTMLNTHTDAQGNFTLENVSVGEVNLEISKHGYYPYTSGVIEVLADQINQFNLTISALPQFTFSGTVTAKTDGLPIEHARIELKGYDNFVTYSDENGKYEITGVRGDTGSLYYVTASSEYGKKQLAEISIETNTSYDIQLVDNPLCVHNVSLNTDADPVLTWSEPMPELARDNGIPVDYIGWTHGHSECIIGTVFRNLTVIKEVSWYVSGLYTHSNFNIFIFGLDDEGNPDVKNLRHIARDVEYEEDAWSSYVLPKAIEADGFMVAISCDNFMGLGITVPTDEEPFEEGQSYFAGDNYTWNITPMSNFGQYHPMIRVYGEIKGDSSHGLRSPARTVALTRPAPVYDIYRFIEGAGRNKWTLIGTTSDHSFTDTEFKHLPEEAYRYAVVAVYPESESIPRVSPALIQTGINSVVEESLVTLSPTPVADHLHISNADTVNELAIYSTNGVVCSIYVNPTSDIDVSSLAPGVYVVMVQLNNGKHFTTRLVKK
ncbi:MAG: carboxypeptidase regulatory-like domain-containing protein [Muribaculaceae bacterium]|nr:carboxypeptidase regulatory-like domain-containing protein [Muribaculaceae bacterium]